MKLVVDVNLSPAWVGRLAARGLEAVHWSDVGAVTAEDHEILRWTQTQGRVLVTNDLDFSASSPPQATTVRASFKSAPRT